MTLRKHSLTASSSQRVMSVSISGRNLFLWGETNVCLSSWVTDKCTRSGCRVARFPLCPSEWVLILIEPFYSTITDYLFSELNLTYKIVWPVAMDYQASFVVGARGVSDMTRVKVLTAVTTWRDFPSAIPTTLLTCKRHCMVLIHLITSVLFRLPDQGWALSQPYHR